jgi:hypothetical protein
MEDDHAGKVSPLRAAYGVAGHDAVPMAYSALPPRSRRAHDTTHSVDDVSE